jgi:DNA invertase Pin-like site-specific DNA recombinase
MEHFNNKITSVQLKRKAILYIRQSTMHQVYENTESTLQQYALKEKLIQLGGYKESIIIIDCDLGYSGADSSERDGFKRLVADVGSGEVGAVASIECSRLSRSSHDWGRLMEICAITQTILIDADGIYNPNNFNDRLLLGLKGTMSEAELHFLMARMRGGALNKAKRGEFRVPLPVGYIYDEAGIVKKNPNLDVQNAIKLFFEIFQICGSANKMLSYYRKNGYKIPKYQSKDKEIIWIDPSSTRAVNMLHNPAYAGIYAYGQRQFVNTINGKKKIKAEKMHVYIEGHHEGYISMEEFNKNQDKLRSNRIFLQSSPPREGKALLQGLVICGKCGARMSAHYSVHGEKSVPYYICNDQARHYTGEKRCQNVHGTALDETVSQLVLERINPTAIKNAIQVQKEITQHCNDSDNYFLFKVEHAKYEVDLAKRRYMNVDPTNRLVALELEKLWNIKIAELAKTEEELRNHEKTKEHKKIKDVDIEKLSELPNTIKKLWKNDKVSINDKKRILRCLIKDITITRESYTTKLGICFKGGNTTIIECDNKPKNYTTWTTSQDIVDIIRKESKCHTSKEISDILNTAGYKSGKGLEITANRVAYLQREYKIPSYKKYLHSKGYLSASEKAMQLGIRLPVLHQMKTSKEFQGKVFRTSEKGDYMFSPN